MNNSHRQLLKIALITLGDPNTLTGGYLYHRKLAMLAPRHNARIKFVSFPERLFPLALVDAPALFRRAYNMGANALVLDSIAAAFAGPWLALHRPELPLVGMLHQPPGGIDHNYLRTSVQAKLDRLAYRRAGLLMVASESLRDQLIAQGMPPKRLRVVPPGRNADVQTGSPAGTADGPEQQAYMITATGLRQGRSAAALCVANWVERKGIHSLLEACSRLPEQAVTLHLVGDNRVDERYTAALRARLARPDLAGRVVVHGPLPAATVSAMYAAADLFVLPSTKEPYGTVFGEAMAEGLPVVGWRAGNLPYLAGDQREGLLVDTGDVAELARALGKLAFDPALRQRTGRGRTATSDDIPHLG